LPALQCEARARTKYTAQNSPKTRHFKFFFAEEEEAYPLPRLEKYSPPHTLPFAPNQAFWIRPCPARFVSMLPRMHLSVLPVDLRSNCKKGKGFPYSILSVGPGADPDVQAVSLQVTVKSSTRR